jgi:hypothetical protein
MTKTKDVADIFKSLGAAHQQISAIHKARGDDDLAVAHGHASDACMECDKALDDFLSKTLVPDSVSSVPPTDTPESGFGILARPPRMVLRNGQASEELQKLAANVPVEFQHLIRD